MRKHVGRVLFGVAILAAWAAIAVVPASAGTVTVYSQPPNFNGEYASQNDTNGLGNFATAYDNFTLSATTSIDSVEWVGSYFNPQAQGAITGFTVSFYANNGGIPGALLATYGFAGTAGETFLQNDNIGDPTYQYGVTIPDFPATGGTEYWLSIVPDLGFQPQWGWETGSGGDGAAYQCYFGACGPIPSDLAFSLDTTITTTTPEPGSVLLLATALAGLGLMVGKSYVDKRKGAMKLFQTLGMAAVVALAVTASASAQTRARQQVGSATGTWTTPNNQPGEAVGPMLQLRDGRILVNESQGPDTGVWFILTPDAHGSYVNGTWTTTGHLPSGYQPIYFGSQVDINGATGQVGQIVIEGGEYNMGTAVWTTLGARGTYTAGGNVTWVSNSPPTGWGTIGDAESVVLPDGVYMQSNCCTQQNALYNGPNSWVATGNVKQPNNDESGFTLLTNNLVLTVDAKADAACSTRTGSELYNQTTGVWSCAANTPVPLYNPNDEELGPAVMMYNNKVFQIGGNIVATAVYDVASNTWAAGPTPANGLDGADAPAALEPNGLVLAMLSPGLFNSGCQFVEYNPTSSTLANAPNPTNCPGDSSFVGHLMILPTGQIMFTDFSPLVEVYTPVAGVVAGVAPKILLPSTFIASGSLNNILYGYQLNGLTQNNAYGDDYQGDTNYPLVRLTSANGNVYYCFTHDDGPAGATVHSIAPGHFGYTHFDVPAVPAGTYNLQAVTNGIGSNSIVVTVH